VITSPAADVVLAIDDVAVLSGTPAATIHQEAPAEGNPT